MGFESRLNPKHFETDEKFPKKTLNDFDRERSWQDRPMVSSAKFYKNEVNYVDSSGIMDSQSYGGRAMK